MGTALARRHSILTDLKSSGFVTASQLADQMDVSVSTARRDLQLLADSGLVRKIHGGATRPHEPPFSTKEAEASAAMFRTAAALVCPGMTVGIVSGSGAGQLASALGSVADITVVTNSLEVSHRLNAGRSSTDALRVIVLPGTLDATGSALGSLCVEAVQLIFLDLAYCSVGGYESKSRAFSDSFENGEIIRAFARSSRQTVALAEQSHWSRLSPSPLHATMFNSLIVDHVPSASDCHSIAGAGVDLHIRRTNADIPD